jgi:hypothetical protein
MSLRKVTMWASLPGLVVAGMLAAPLVATATSTSTCSDGSSPTSPPTSNCKTVTINDVNGISEMTNPTSGIIEFGSGLTASTTYNLADGIYVVGTVQTYVPGSYTLTWGTCTDGSATTSTYSVDASGNKYPTAPATTGTLPTITAGTDGAFSCPYTLSYPGTTAVDPNGTSVFNAAVVIGGPQVASPSFKPGGGPPTGIPESPFAVLLPLSALVLLGGLAFIVYRRRLATQS